MASFVGREREMQVLDQRLREAFAGDGQLLLVTGEAGIGKTRLAEELTRLAQSLGFFVAWGRAWEGEGTPAYFPWRQALRTLARGLGARFASACAADADLSALVAPKLERARAGDPEEARFRMSDAVAELLRALSSETPLVIILDDVHVADHSTLQLLHFVARHLRGDARLLLVASLRDGATQTPAASQQLLAKIAREASSMPLGRLGRAALVSWLGEAAADLTTSVDRVLSVSEGNPLFVGELLAAATKRPGQAWASAHELPLGIREAIRGHLALLSSPTQGLLAIAAVLGRDFQRATLLALAGTARGELEEAVGAGLLLATSVDEADPRFRFTHVLIRDELYASLEPERRSELHRAAALYEQDPALAAPHWLLGARREDAAAALSVVRAAMADAQARLAFEDAGALGQRALGAIPCEGRVACELGIAVGHAWLLSGDVPAARQAGARAGEAARALGDGALIAQAALLQATELSVGNRSEASVQFLREALAGLAAGDSGLRAQVMARLSVALLPAPPHEHEAALQLASEAIAMARRLGDEETLFAVLRFTRTSPSETDDAQTRFALNAETIALAQKFGRVPLVASLFSWQVAARLELADADGAVREAEAMERLLSAYRQPGSQYRLPLVRAMLADIEGRFAEADALSREARSFSEKHGIFAGTALFLTQRMGFLYTRGDDDGWAELEPFALATLGKDPLFQLFRCLFDAMCGRTELVRAALNSIGRTPLHSLPDGAGLAGACAAAGVVEHAQAFYDLLLAESRKGPWQFGPGRVTSMGPRALTLGRLAVLLGKKADALAHFGEALAYVEQLRARPFIAQTQLEIALLSVSSNPSRARERAGLAFAIATEVGMRRVAARASAVIAELTSEASRPAPPLAPRPTATPQLLLEREGETWRLSALGRQVVLKDAKGLSYLDALVRSPCREVHVLELSGLRDDGDAGPVLDERAKRAYRERAQLLRHELDDATSYCDPGRAERARLELDTLAGELSKAFGLGGRERRAVSPTERARINVQRRIRDAIERVRTLDEALGEHLGLSVRTGLFCVYLPTFPARSD